MTRGFAFELGAWLLAAALVAAAAVSYRAERQRLRELSTAPGRLWMLAPPAVPAAESLAAAIDSIADRNLFRDDRESDDDAPPLNVASIPVTPAAPPKPALVLRGILGGPPWNAILGGIPGRDGDVVVRQGDSLSGLRVRTVKPTGIVVRGMDTTWTLTLAR